MSATHCATHLRHVRYHPTPFFSLLAYAMSATHLTIALRGPSVPCSHPPRGVRTGLAYSHTRFPVHSYGVSATDIRASTSIRQNRYSKTLKCVMPGTEKMMFISEKRDVQYGHYACIIFLRACYGTDLASVVLVGAVQY
eukprot:2118564-Rhodomonas_salina.2